MACPPCSVCAERSGGAVHLTRPSAAAPGHEETTSVCSDNCSRILRHDYPLGANPTPGQLRAAILSNDAFRTVLYTSADPGAPGAFQLVAMTMWPGERAAWEVHPHNAQYFAVVAGAGAYVTNPAAPASADRARACAMPISERAGSKFTVEAGQYHEVGNFDAAEPLRLLSMYVPPHHPRRRVDATQRAAEEREAAEEAAATR